MKSIADTIKYTKKKKKHQLEKLGKRRSDVPTTEIHDFMDDIEDDSSVGLNLSYLSFWYNWRFNDFFINENKNSTDDISLSVLYGIESNKWEYNLGSLYPKYDDAILFKFSAKHLAGLNYLGWNDMAISYGHLLLEMLYGKQYRGGSDYPTHTWFIIELFCKWQNIELDKSRLNYPENLGIYEQALNHWDSEDTQKVSDIIDKLADFHIQQSDENVTTDEFGNEGSPEFTSSDYFIFPLEILMWLAVRRNLGLPDYIPSASNELMQLGINKLPTVDIPILKVELIEKCKEKLRRDNPDIKLIP